MEICNSCKKPFNVSEHELAMPGTKELESIFCPYCNHLNREEICNGWWVSHKLTDKEIEEYEKKSNKKIE
jgi:DNA-directed RNA polymerase subunit RPC12/RpoP